MRINQQLQAAIREHAAREHPAEACGVLIKTAEGREYVPCRNLARTPRDQFPPPETKKPAEAGM